MQMIHSLHVSRVREYRWLFLLLSKIAWLFAKIIHVPPVGHWHQSLLPFQSYESSHEYGEWFIHIPSFMHSFWESLSGRVSVRYETRTKQGCKAWQRVLQSAESISRGALLNLEDGYKGRCRWVIKDPISIQQQSLPTAANASTALRPRSKGAAFFRPYVSLIWMQPRACTLLSARAWPICAWLY